MHRLLAAHIDVGAAKNAIVDYMTPSKVSDRHQRDTSEGASYRDPFAKYSDNPRKPTLN